jgi:hypothetical protein
MNMNLMTLLNSIVIGILFSMMGDSIYPRESWDRIIFLMFCFIIGVGFNLSINYFIIKKNKKLEESIK